MTSTYFANHRPQLFELRKHWISCHPIVSTITLLSQSIRQTCNIILHESAAMSQLTIFQKHLLNLTLRKTNIITPYESLRGFLSLGLDFPVALISSIGLPLVYGNTGFLSHKIDITKIPRHKQPTQLENVVVPTGKKEFTRTEVLGLLHEEHQRSGEGLGMRKKWFDRSHVLGVWIIGALTQGERKGKVDGKVLKAFMRGEFFEIVRERRRERSDVLPLWRGGPIS